MQAFRANYLLPALNKSRDMQDRGWENDVRRGGCLNSPSEKPIGGLFGRTAWTKLKTIDAIRFNKLNFSYILLRHAG
jgi:hypothetical protein